MIIDDIKTIIIQYVTPDTEHKLKYISVWKNIRMHYRMAMVNELDGHEPRWYNKYIPHEALKLIDVKQFIMEHIMLSKLHELLAAYKPVKTEIETVDDFCKFIVATAKKMIVCEDYYHIDDSYSNDDGDYHIYIKFNTAGGIVDFTPCLDIIDKHNGLLAKLNITKLYEDVDTERRDSGIEYYYSCDFHHKIIDL
jgi:hypothetical protein